MNQRRPERREIYGLSCYHLVDDQDNFLRRLTLLQRVKHQSLTTLREKPVKIETSVVTHCQVSEGRSGYARTTGYDPENRDLVFESVGRIATDSGRIALENYDSVGGTQILGFIRA